jgi:hypothetical protein
MTALTDTERLDWLEENQGYAVVSDDFGHWACVSEGMQNVPLKAPGDIATSFFIQKKQWKKSVRKAIDGAMGEK